MLIPITAILSGTQAECGEICNTDKSKKLLIMFILNYFLLVPYIYVGIRIIILKLPASLGDKRHNAVLDPLEGRF